MRTMFGGSAAASEPKRKIAKRDRAAEKQAGRSVIRVVPGDPERRRRDGASSCISSWADWSIRARYRILLSGLVTNPGGGIGTRGGRGVRGRGVSGAEELRKKSARNTSAFSPELPREIPRSSSLSSTLATPGSWNTCESEHEQAGEGIAMKTILADNDVEGILAALVSNRRMPPPAAPRAHRSERLAVLELRPRVLIKQTPGGWCRFPSELFGWAIPWVENAVDGGFHMRSTTSIPSNSRPNFKV